MSVNLMPAKFFLTPKIFVFPKSQASQVLHCGSWPMAVGGAAACLTSGHHHIPTVGNKTPRQIEAIISFNYFTRCHDQEILCKYTFYSLRHVNMRPKLYNTERKTKFSLASSLSLSVIGNML